MRLGSKVKLGGAVPSCEQTLTQEMNGAVSSALAPVPFHTFSPKFKILLANWDGRRIAARFF